MRLAEQEEKKGVGSPGLTCCAQFFLSSSCCWRILAISFWCCSASSDAQSWTVVAIGEEAKKSHRAEMGSGPRRKGGRGYEVGTLVSTQERFHLGTNLQRQPLRSLQLCRPSFKAGASGLILPPQHLQQSWYLAGQMQPRRCSICPTQDLNQKKISC